MRKEDFEAIARALTEADVRFIVVGGIAVIEHGYGLDYMERYRNLPCIGVLRKELITK